MIQVGLQDGLLAELLFKAMGQPRFAELALPRARSIQEGVAHVLLRDGARALRDAAATQVGHRCSGDAPQVDAVVIEETPILGRDDGADAAVRTSARAAPASGALCRVPR